MCSQCTRREFLQAGMAAGFFFSTSGLGHAGTRATLPAAVVRKARVGVIFTGNPGPADRGWGADTTQYEAIKARLAKAEEHLGNVELMTGQARTAADTATLLQQFGPRTPVLAINLGIFALTPVVQPILEGAHPCVVFSLPASGHDWLFAHRWQRQGKPVTLFPTGDYNEL